MRAAADLRAAGTTSMLFVSVQVETAWGKFNNGPFVGIDTDRADFPFMQMIGLSSYPYLAYVQPEDIPNDHYSRLQSSSAPLPMMVVEGGWPSASVGTMPGQVMSTPALQMRYVTRHAALLDSMSALGWTQLEFADIDPAAFPQPAPPASCCSSRSARGHAVRGQARVGAVGRAVREAQGLAGHVSAAG